MTTRPRTWSPRCSKLEDRRGPEQATKKERQSQPPMLPRVMERGRRQTHDRTEIEVSECVIRVTGAKEEDGKEGRGKEGQKRKDGGQKCA